MEAEDTRGRRATEPRVTRRVAISRRMPEAIIAAVLCCQRSMMRNIVVHDMRALAS